MFVVCLVSGMASLALDVGGVFFLSDRRFGGIDAMQIWASAFPSEMGLDSNDSFGKDSPRFSTVFRSSGMSWVSFWAHLLLFLVGEGEGDDVGGVVFVFSFAVGFSATSSKAG